MDRVTIAALIDELEKISGDRSMAKHLNEMFGLPIHKGGKGRVRVYENGPSSAQSADRSQYPVAGMAAGPNLSAGNVMSPSYGPGGV